MRSSFSMSIGDNACSFITFLDSLTMCRSVKQIHRDLINNKNGVILLVMSNMTHTVTASVYEIG